MSQLEEKNSFRKILKRNILLPLCAGIFSSAIFLFLINALVEQTRRVEHTDQIISLANSGLRSFVDGETGLRGYLLTGRTAFLEPLIDSRVRFPNDLNSMQELLSNNKIQLDRLAALRALYTNWSELADKMQADKKAGKDVGEEVAHGVGKSMMDEARNLFDKLIMTEERQRRERSESVQQMTQMVLAIAVISSLLIFGLIALSGRKQLIELSTSYDNALKVTRDQNQYLQHQQWIKTAQTELAERMAAQRGLGDLANTIVSYLAYYLNAQVGALYVVSNGQSLELQGCYAYSHGAAPPQVLFFGESLVGQAAIQKQTLYLKNVPADYIKVSSGTGSSTPAELLIVPIFESNETHAVIELGFFNSVDSRYADLFSNLNEGISTSLKSAHSRDQREKLIREIQNQAKELQTQKEELRAMNEELEEQADHLKSSQSRLEMQQTELEQSNEELARQTAALESQKDLLDRRNGALEEAKVALEQKAKELQRASQYKSEFLANMSHELRTPLNSSLILAKLLSENKEKNLSAQQVEFAKQILSSGNDLLCLINDILDLSKVESGKLDINPDHMSIESLMNSLKMFFDPLALEKKLHLSIEIGPGTPKFMFCDRLRLEQILKNLLSNALKFTSSGSVALKINSVQFSDIQEWLKFSVVDTGVGIRKEHQQVIFEAFKQADGTTTRKYGGTGLGLAISKDLARLLGGNIVVESEFGQGSTFTLNIPRHSEVVSSLGGHLEPRTISHSLGIHDGFLAEEMKEKAPSGSLSQERFFQDDLPLIEKNHERNILVVEDDFKFAKILYDLAHEQNYKCLVTNMAEEAVQLAAQHLPSAVILDIKLADQNGLYALDQIKSNPKTRHIPVHVISASDFSRQAMQLGAVGYMLKPVKREQLVDAFENLQKKISQDIRKVLILEDDEVQRNAICKLIEDKNLDISAVESGLAAYDLLMKHSFDCMIMDLNLADMSGFELLKKMDESPRLSFPPIIVYTGQSLSKDEEVQLGRYSKSVIIKGAKSPERLLDEVTLFLDRVQSGLDKTKQDMLENLRNREQIFDGKSIMIVDDDMRNTFALTAALEEKGARIVIARNGRECISKLQEEKRLDLVLMDIMMPVMDGYEATREIRQNTEFKKLPVIALTAKAMKDDRQKCLEAGANDYLPKPVDLNKLISLARIWISAGWS